MKYSNAEVLETIESDGIGSALDNIKSKEISDPELAELWRTALELLADITEYLADNHLDPFAEEDEDESYD